MGAVSNLKDTKKSLGSPRSLVKGTQENSNPSDGMITVLMLATVLAVIGGLAFHFFKNRKTKQEKQLDKSSPKELENVSN